MKNYNQKQDNFPKQLAQPARRALASAGYTRLEQLAEVSEEEISKLYGMGEHAITQLRLALEAKGLTFKKA